MKSKKQDEKKELFKELHDATNKFNSDPDNSKIPAVFKKIDSKKILLSKKFERSKISVEQAIENRTSSSSYSGTMTQEDISKILFYANGFRKLEDYKQFGIVCNTNAPSAGSTHSIELYVILRNVSGINDGIYHYDLENHALEIIEEKTIPQLKVQRLFRQDNFNDANCLLFMTSIHKRTSWKYGPRAYRLVHLDAGRIGQNVYLVGETMGLSVSGIGGWHDNPIEKLLRIDGTNELIIYAMAIGKKNADN